MEIIFKLKIEISLVGIKKYVDTKSFPNYPTEKEIEDFYEECKEKLPKKFNFLPGDYYFEGSVDKVFILNQPEWMLNE